ncbi:MAG: S8 family serine peptidase [Tannerella sp.]|jgi:subtilisin family serine protease|nr:S8 family serine peptidase [Tannerella sp.]
MNKKRFIMRQMKLAILFLAITTMNLLAQTDYFYNPQGKHVNFIVRTDKILVKMKPSEGTTSLQNLPSGSSVNDIGGNYRMITVTTKEKPDSLLKRNPAIQDAYYMLEYEDGTMQAVTNQIFLKPKGNNSLAKCLTAAGLPSQPISERLILPEDSIYLIALDLPGKNMMSVVRHLYETGLCEFAEPDFLKFMHVDDDDVFDEYWGLYNYGIRANRVWPNFITGSGVKVAVLDLGVDLTHPDLAANMLPGYDATTGAPQGANGSPCSWDPHGTYCAGIIAAVYNSIGITGAAYSAKIIPIRIAYTTTMGSHAYIMFDSWIVDAFNYARTTAQADVISCSWQMSPSTSVTTAINDAISSGRNGKGCVVVFSSGNDTQSTIPYPANLASVIAVGSATWNSTRAPSSNYGTDLDVVAPGVYIGTTDIQGSGGSSPNDYDIESGTSMACPFVSGIAALLIEANPNLSGANIKSIIESTARKIGNYIYTNSSGHSNGTWNNEMGYGMADAPAAIASLNATISGSDIVSCSGSTYTSNIAGHWDVSGDITIISGQGTNSITVASSSSAAHRPAQIYRGGASKAVYVGAPPITSITGPQQVNVNSSGTYYATSIPNATYHWELDGNPVGNGNYVASITFNSTGTHTVTCFTSTPCSGMEQDLLYYYVTVH